MQWKRVWQFVDVYYEKDSICKYKSRTLCVRVREKVPSNKGVKYKGKNKVTLVILSDTLLKKLSWAKQHSNGSWAPRVTHPGQRIGPHKNELMSGRCGARSIGVGRNA